MRGGVREQKSGDEQSVFKKKKLIILVAGDTHPLTTHMNCHTHEPPHTSNKNSLTATHRKRRRRGAKSTTRLLHSRSPPPTPSSSSSSVSRMYMYVCVCVCVCVCARARGVCLCVCARARALCMAWKYRQCNKVIFSLSNNNACVLVSLSLSLCPHDIPSSVSPLQ